VINQISTKPEPTLIEDAVALPAPVSACEVCEDVEMQEARVESSNEVLDNANEFELHQPPNT
jgi:hypothetical protein